MVHMLQTTKISILKECNSFYSRLYASKKPTVTSLSDNLFFGQEHSTLNDIDEQKCEGLLSGKECLEALKTMEPGIKSLLLLSNSTNNVASSFLGMPNHRSLLE